MTDEDFDPPRNTIAAFADLSYTDRMRYRLSMLSIDAGMALSNAILPEEIQEAAKADTEAAEEKGLKYTLQFERQYNEEKGHNVYVFDRDGRRIELSPGATVSELQNRI